MTRASTVGEIMRAFLKIEGIGSVQVSLADIVRRGGEPRFTAKAFRTTEAARAHSAEWLDPDKADPEVLLGSWQVSLVTPIDQAPGDTPEEALSALYRKILKL